MYSELNGKENVAREKENNKCVLSNNDNFPCKK